MTALLLADPRPQIAALGASRIREVADAGMGRKDVLAFWFGESDQPTPAFICEAAAAALRDGRTFYTQNMGIPDLRQAIATYVSRLHGLSIAMERIAVTNSGVNGLMVAMQAVLDPGDRVVAVTPVWPNLVQIPRILSAEVTEVPLWVKDGVWSLDLEALLAALIPGTRLLVINSPSNPTGWQIAPEQQRVILDHCRRRGIWIMADEVYERLTFVPGLSAAPSFLSIADADDRVIGVNSFSKAWTMTGWRLGWLVLPAALAAHFPKLLEYNTSSAPEFVQVAAISALNDGEADVARAHARLAANRDLLVRGLRRINSIEVTEPAGGMYAFFRFDADSVAVAKRLVMEVGLGLAPGAAFGSGGEGFLRWCFAASAEKLTAGLERLSRFKL